MQIEDNSRDTLVKYFKSQEKKYIETHKNNADNSDFTPASVFDRSPRMAYKFAGLHCLADNRLSIDLADINFGIHTADLLTNWVVEKIKDKELSNIDPVRQKKIDRVISILKKSKSGLSAREIAKGFSSTVKSDDIKALILDLCLSGKLLAFDTNNQAKELETKLEKGFTYALPK